MPAPLDEYRRLGWSSEHWDTAIGSSFPGALFIQLASLVRHREADNHSTYGTRVRCPSIPPTSSRILFSVRAVPWTAELCALL